jgi:hypothetical protein
MQSESVNHICIYIVHVLYTTLLGSEMRNWLLFYSLPVLNGVLPNPYLSHYSLLVAGLLLLTSDRITPEDIRNAELYLKEFYVKYPELYGKCTGNYLPIQCFIRGWGGVWDFPSLT